MMNITKKYIVLLILFSNIALFAFGQTDDEKLKQSIIDSAVKVMGDMQKQMQPYEDSIVAADSTTTEAKYILSTRAYWKGDTAKAMYYYEQILQMTASDKNDSVSKYMCADRLALINFRRKNYIETINYLNLAKKYPSGEWCDNGRAATDARIAEMYYECYMGIQEYKNAISVLKDYMFPDAFRMDYDFAPKLYAAYLKLYTKEQIKTEFMNAEKTLTFQREKNYQSIYFHALIKIFEDTIDAPGSWSMDESLGYWPRKEEEQRKQSIAAFKSSEIFKFATDIK